MARRANRRSKTRSKPRRTSVPPRRVRIKRPDAEALLLDLARDIPIRTDASMNDAEALVGTLASAYAPEMPLATALREDWLRGRGNKTAGLALAFAREQVRLAVSDVLQRARAKRTVRADADVDTLAWLVLSACEALTHEPPSAVSDRTQALVMFLHAR
jgi:hypothetical protein